MRAKNTGLESDSMFSFGGDVFRLRDQQGRLFDGVQDGVMTGAAAKLYNAKNLGEVTQPGFSLDYAFTFDIPLDATTLTIVPQSRR